MNHKNITISLQRAIVEDIFIYSKGKATQPRVSSSDCWFTPQMPAAARAGASQHQEPDTPTCLAGRLAPGPFPAASWECSQGASSDAPSSLGRHGCSLAPCPVPSLTWICACFQGNLISTRSLPVISVTPTFYLVIFSFSLMYSFFGGRILIF